MFWCTYLVIESYSSSYADFPSYPENAGQGGSWWGLIAANNLAINGFRSAGHLYWDRDEIPANQLQAGDVVFFHNTNRRAGINHVAIVHSIHDGVVTTIHSNAGYKVLDLSIASNGYVQDYGYLEVEAFARYRPPPPNLPIN